jgi:transcriptional regulator with GAF, ATPase, and Fis domain
VIDRAVILARGGALEFDLPTGNAPATSGRKQSPKDENVEQGFLTEVEMRQRERENLLAVLEKTHWKIKGANGAAELLSVKPTTLLFGIKIMGLRRP